MQKLSGVSETLLLILYYRYRETKRPDAIIQDPKSIELVENIDYDFTKFSITDPAQAFIAIRTEIFDREVKALLEKYPNANVINLGAGLCTRFSRVDNSQIKWWNLDLQEVIQIAKEMIGETDRHQYCNFSILDGLWIKELQEKCLGNKTIFIAEGLFYYFEEKEVKKIIGEMKNNFPGADLLIEVISPLSIKFSKKPDRSLSNNVQFRWGIEDLKEIEKWSEGIQVISEFYCFDRHSSRWGWKQFFKYIPILRNSVRIGHIRFE